MRKRVPVNWIGKEDELIALCEDGKSCRSIGEVYGVSRQRVHQVLKRLKLKSNGKIGRKPKISTEIIYTDYLMGKDVFTISDEYNISPTSVRNSLRDKGVTLRRGRYSIEDIHNMYVLKTSKGWGVKEIAEEFGCCTLTVYRLLKKYKEEGMNGQR